MKHATSPMSDQKQLRTLHSARLREARELRGFKSARSAQLRFGWSSAYPSHEKCGQAVCEPAHRIFMANHAELSVLGHRASALPYATVAGKLGVPLDLCNGQPIAARSTSLFSIAYSRDACAIGIPHLGVDNSATAKSRMVKTPLKAASPSSASQEI
jgi:hypothetical protein